MSLTYSTAEAAQQLGAPSERWLIESIRNGKFPARKIGRYWRMTDQDIQDALDACANNHRTDRRRGHVTGAATGTHGLTPTSRKRVAAL